MLKMNFNTEHELCGKTTWVMEDKAETSFVNNSKHLRDRRGDKR